MTTPAFPHKVGRLGAPAAVLAVLALSGAALAQAPGGCTPRGGGEDHVEMTCGGGLVILVERRARYRIVDADGDRTPEGVRLDRGAILVEAPATGAAGFQILTPRAIASVRGTTYAVDATGTETAVFVEEGAVNVTARGSGAGLVLRTGEGTDVTGNEPQLVARRWGARRIEALLSRFGR